MTDRRQPIIFGVCANTVAFLAYCSFASHSNTCSFSWFMFWCPQRVSLIQHVEDHIGKAEPLETVFLYAN